MERQLVEKAVLDVLAKLTEEIVMTESLAEEDRVLEIARVIIEKKEKEAMCKTYELVKGMKRNELSALLSSI